MLLHLLLKYLVRSGSLELECPDGSVHRYGDGTGATVRIKFHDAVAMNRAAFFPRLRIGEAYVDGTMTIEKGTLKDFLYVVGHNLVVQQDGVLQRIGRRFQNVVNLAATYNPVGKAQKNVAHHYDLNGEFFELFLDSDKQYSCAYFETPDTDLETAQVAKKAHVAKKLRIEPGMKVLDIGSGWGGLGLYLAQNYDCDVTGVTLSVEQHKVSNQRARDAGIDDRVRFELKDYRHLDQCFDRIVSVGMFEHVGPRHYDEFFAKVKDLLKDDGIAMIHTIGRMGTPEPISPWMRKYIFPGAYLPTLTEITRPIEKQWLWLTDFEVWREHYADTLLRWHERFMANRGKVRALYDEKFCRMWEMYLLGCEMGFRIQELCVFQIQLARKIDTVPRSRAYLYRN
ncbi:class I SAM-dependent methyltransferase [Pacificispira sp.]|uniref:class I SAM-dependent methyltransferase n=1 Tax=Pacificispira sp. TaxID=2888761 RepID=UPI003BAAC148